MHIQVYLPVNSSQTHPSAQWGNFEVESDQFQNTFVYFSHEFSADPFSDMISSDDGGGPAGAFSPLKKGSQFMTLTKPPKFQVLEC